MTQGPTSVRFEPPRRLPTARSAGAWCLALLPVLVATLTPADAQRVFQLAPPGTVDSDRPVISGNGRRVGIVVGSELHLVNADGSGLTSTGLSWVTKFDISFDGRLVALTHLFSSHGPTPHVDVLDTETSQLTLVSPPSMEAWEPAISADGSTVVFTDIDFQCPEGYNPGSGTSTSTGSGTLASA